jgi:hypothetical protein
MDNSNEEMMEELLGKICRWKSGFERCAAKEITNPDKDIVIEEYLVDLISTDCVLLPVKSVLVWGTISLIKSLPIQKTHNHYFEIYEVLVTDRVSKKQEIVLIPADWIEKW